MVGMSDKGFCKGGFKLFWKHIALPTAVLGVVLTQSSSALSALCITKVISSVCLSWAKMPGMAGLKDADFSTMQKLEKVRMVRWWI